MEKTVHGITGMLGDFVKLVEDQSESIEDVNMEGKTATKTVQDTEKDLSLTLERSKSHRWTMIIAIMILSLLF